MARVLRAWIGIIGAVAVATGGMGCTISQQEPPPLQGPSELAVSVSLTAMPDIIAANGTDRADITILVRDGSGAPLADYWFRAEIMVTSANGLQLVDCGSLSSRSVGSGGDGRALLTYTAPSGSCGPISDIINIRITPFDAGSAHNAQNQLARTVGIKLVPEGGIVPGAPTPSFTMDGSDLGSISVSPFVDVFFNGSASTPELGATIVGFDWNFGDGDTASGVTAQHQFNPGPHQVSLTVTDNNGLASTLVKKVEVGAATEPTADFVYSPSTVSVGTVVRFNGSISAPDPARTIVDWHWRFGDGGSAHGSQVSHTYKATGAYAVVLTVVDDKRLSGTTSQTINVGSPDPVAQFVFSPSTPGPGTTVNFNASASSAVSGRTIVSYVWDFGDGSPAATGVTTSHSYGAVGTYTVVLTVTDSEGETAVATTTVPVM